MKKIYFKLVLVLLLASWINTHAENGTRQKIDPGKANQLTTMKNAGPLMTPSMLAFGTDVVINSASENQQDLKIATAFNGWVFAAYTSHGGANDGIYVMTSHDHGQTWSPFMSSSGTFYYTDIAVCGNDINSLDLFLTSVNHNSANYVFWVDRYNANTQTFLDEPVFESSTDSIYDVALAHDFLHPSSSSTPYSVEAVYTRNGVSGDSLIAFLSTDGGISFNDRKSVDGTADRFGKVAVSYGYSPAFSSGRYFLAYEQRVVGNKYGHIKECRTDAQITDAFTAPVYIDSAYSTFPSYWSNHAVNPTISVQNSSANNDSSGLSVLVLWESDYNGGVDIDIVGAYSLKGASTSTIATWKYCYPDYSSATHSKNPHASFDEANNYFLVTYWDSTNNKLPYCVQNFNMPNPIPTTWPVTNTQYNDQVGSLLDPHPQIANDPSDGTVDLAWQEIRSTFRTALFDAGLTLTGIQAHQNANQNQFNLYQNYPNPSGDFTVIRFDLDQAQQTSLEVYDVVGNKVSTLVNDHLSAGSYQFNTDVRQLPAGYYVYTLKAGSSQQNKKLLVVH